MKKTHPRVQELVLAELAIAPLIKQLAVIAVRLGVTPREIADALKAECVNVAAQYSTLRNGRVNHSRVAVVTGLSRAEIRGLLARESKSSDIHQARASRHRAWRLVAAWMADPRFRRAQFTERERVSGVTTREFRDLARAHCGDVTAKAVLAELKRMGVVESVGSKLVLRHGASQKLRKQVGEARRLIRVTSDLLGTPGEANERHVSLVKRVQVQLESQSERDIMLKQVESTLSAAHNAIRYLSERPFVRGTPTQKPRSRAVLDVSSIVTTWMPSGPEHVRRQKVTR